MIDDDNIMKYQLLSEFLSVIRITFLWLFCCRLTIEEEERTPFPKMKMWLKYSLLLKEDV